MRQVLIALWALVIGWTPCVADAQTADTAGSSQATESAAVRNAGKVAVLGFTKTQLQSVIYIRRDLVNPPEAFMTLGELLAQMFDRPRITKITRIESGKYKGFAWKIAGSAPSGLLFSIADGEALVTHVVQDGNAQRLQSTQDEYGASTLLQFLPFL